MTIAQLVRDYGYPADRVLKVVGNISIIPSMDTRAARLWKENNPHRCDEFSATTCVAIHYPGCWSAFIKEQVDK